MNEDPREMDGAQLSEWNDGIDFEIFSARRIRDVSEELLERFQ